jgi:AraC-like DNA-binding protein
MEYREYKPAKLHNLVLSIFERKVSFPMKVQFLPNNCITLIFSLGDKIPSAKGENVDSEVFNPTGTFCFLSGLHTKPLYFEMTGLHSFGMTMHPAGFKAFFGMPTEEVKDQAIEWNTNLDLAFIEDHIRGLASFEERAYWLEDYFFRKLDPAGDLELASRLSLLTTRMKQDVLLGKRPDLEAYSGYSKMHTHRIFKDWLGLTPGKLIRYEQFQHAIGLMHRSEKSLTEIGLESGFYDQAHFIRVFEEFARMTPGHYKNHKTRLPGILPW